VGGLREKKTVERRDRGSLQEFDDLSVVCRTKKAGRGAGKRALVERNREIKKVALYYRFAVSRGGGGLRRGENRDFFSGVELRKKRHSILQANNFSCFKARHEKEREGGGGTLFRS